VPAGPSYLAQGLPKIQENPAFVVSESSKQLNKYTFGSSYSRLTSEISEAEQNNSVPLVISFPWLQHRRYASAGLTEESARRRHNRHASTPFRRGILEEEEKTKQTRPAPKRGLAGQSASVYNNISSLNDLPE